MFAPTSQTKAGWSPWMFCWGSKRSFWNFTREQNFQSCTSIGRGSKTLLIFYVISHVSECLWLWLDCSCDFEFWLESFDWNAWKKTIKVERYAFCHGFRIAPRIVTGWVAWLVCILWFAPRGHVFKSTHGCTNRHLGSGCLALEKCPCCRCLICIRNDRQALRGATHISNHPDMMSTNPNVHPTGHQSLTPFHW